MADSISNSSTIPQAPAAEDNRTVMQNAVRQLGVIAQILDASFPQVTGTASSATAGAATLPANPVGFIVITLPSGTSAKVPYYT
jgi:hypothetical protein